jgi:O-acetylserine/cysteine efflux transporter
MSIGEYKRMNANRRHAVAALVSAGLLWGTTVPLSKLALEWLSPGWLTVVRFGLAAGVLLVAGRRRGLRRAFTPAVLGAGAIGYGGSVLLQNAGLSRTSVTHAALLIGAVPVLVAIIAALWHRAVARPAAWFGFALSLGGVGLVTVGSRGGGATLPGDGLVLASLVLSATVIVAQGRLLTGRDPVAVTAVQFLGAALAALPVAVVTGGMPPAAGGTGPVLAVVALAAGGTLLPFTLFAFGQSRVSAEVAGAFVNIEPLVGAIVGAVAFRDPVGFAQVAGGAAIVAGIGLSSLPLSGLRLGIRRRAGHRERYLAGLVPGMRVPHQVKQPTRCPESFAAHRPDGHWDRSDIPPVSQQTIRERRAGRSRLSDQEPPRQGKERVTQGARARGASSTARGRLHPAARPPFRACSGAAPPAGGVTWRTRSSSSRRTAGCGTRTVG